MTLNKDIVISNTITFAGIMAYIIMFGAIFGNENMLIGVSTITAMLMLLERDLTNRPVHNALKLLLLNLFIGVGAFLTGFNIFLAIPINFIIMFVISYSLLFNLKNPLYLPFSLQYLFILATPVATELLPLRFASLVCGALSIIGIQMLFNKNKITKSGNQKIQAICLSLIDKTKRIKMNETLEIVNTKITTDISALRNIIYDKRQENYYLVEEGRLKLNISASLEKINILLDTLVNEENEQEIVSDLTISLQLVADSIINLDEQTNLEEAFNHMLRKYKDKHSSSLFILSTLNNINFLKENILELKTLGKEQYNVVKSLERIPKKFQTLRISETIIQSNSIKMSYALRMAVAISLTGFITDFFNLTEGRWMMFTVLSVILPIYEQSTKRMRDRIFATVVGGALVTILFMIFKGDIARTILLMTAGYLTSYVKVYRYSTIIVTFSAIAAAALITGTTEILTVNRIMLVSAGVILALFINKVILPYKLEDANRDLKKMYTDAIHEIILEVSDQVKGQGNIHALKNLLLFSNMIEDRIKLNNQGNNTTRGISWLKHQRRLAATIYELYLWIYKYGIHESNEPIVSSRLKLLYNPSTSAETLNASLSKIKVQIRSITRIEDRIVLSMILEITQEVASSKLIVQN